MTVHTVRTFDLATRTQIAELAVADFSYTHAWLAPGSAALTIPRNQPTAPDGTPIVTRENLRPWATGIDILRDTVPVWSGIINGRTTDPVADMIQIPATGWLSYFREKRVRKADKTYTATDQLAIARGIIDDAQAVTGGDLGITTTDTNVSGVNRTRTFTGSERKPYGDELVELALLDDGFDFRFETFLNSSGDLETALRTEYPAIGRGTNHVLAHGDTCTITDIDDDADATAWDVDAVGAGEGASMLISNSVDAVAGAGFPLLEAVHSATDITATALLDAVAARELERTKVLQRRVEVEVTAGLGPQIGEFLVGDRMRVIFSDLFETIDELMRVLSWSVDVSGGSETVSLTLGQLDPSHGLDELSERRVLARRVALLERARRATP